MSKTVTAIALGMLSVAAAIALLARNIKETYPDAYLITKYYNLILIFSVVVGSVGILLVIFQIFRWFVNRAKRHLPLSTIYRVDRATTETDLQWINSSAQSHFGELVSPLEKMRDWRNKNSNIFWLIKRHSTTQTRTTTRNYGYYCLIPLNKRGVDAIANGTLDGTNLSSHEIPRNARQAVGLYIGGIVATDRRAKAQAIADLRDTVDWHKFSKVTRIYAKAATVDGLRLLKRYNFTPTTEGAKGEVGDLFVLERPT